MPPPPAPPPPQADGVRGPEDQDAGGGASGKRARDGEPLVPEGEFLRSYPGPQELHVSVPGQGSVEVGVESLQELVGQVKSKVAEMTGMPASSQKLYSPHLGHLKDGSSLATCNIAPGSTLEVVVSSES